MVQVIYGSSAGLQASSPDDQRWHQNSPSVKNKCETDDRFGWTLTVGDFNNDDHDDLAISAPLESIGSNVLAGCVHILYGSPGGLIKIL